MHYAIPHSVSALLARQMLAVSGRRLPFVTTLHGTDITLVGLDRSYLPITRYSIQESDGVTSISQYLKDKTLADFGITREIAVIPNFVNCDVYAPVRDEAARCAARKHLVGTDEPILIHLSNFRPVKRVVDVVKVFAQVARAIPSQLVLVGDGPDRSAAEWLAHDLGIQARVHFLGKQDRVNELLPLADLMLMPSQLESFGLAALEAMACKVPTIATRVGGVPELIDDRGNRAVIRSGDVDAMAQGAIALLKDPGRLQEMRDTARRAAQKRFCATLVLPQYVKYYESVLATGGLIGRLAPAPLASLRQYPARPQTAAQPRHSARILPPGPPSLRWSAPLCAARFPVSVLAPVRAHRPQWRCTCRGDKYRPPGRQWTA